jgi:cellulose synthase/poly-beta-1,6-N-acetylglucosamine synthase-like glycosyltransferase
MLEFWLCAIALIITLANVINMRVVGIKGATTISESVDVLIPMRDEEENVEGSLKSALNSELLEASNVYVLDDGSTDQTSEVISTISDSRFRYVYQDHQGKVTALKDKITNELTKFETKGIDTTTAKSFIATAETKLNDA